MKVKEIYINLAPGYEKNKAQGLTRSRRRDMNTTLMTFLRVAGSIGAAILISWSWTRSVCVAGCLRENFKRTVYAGEDPNVQTRETLIRLQDIVERRRRRELNIAKRTDI